MTEPNEDPWDPPRETWEHLLQFGYAPGGYIHECRSCGKVRHHMDKRAWRCMPCAKAAHADFLANPPKPDPVMVAIEDIREALDARSGLHPNAVVIRRDHLELALKALERQKSA